MRWAIASWRPIVCVERTASIVRVSRSARNSAWVVVTVIVRTCAAPAREATSEATRSSSITSSAWAWSTGPPRRTRRPAACGGGDRLAAQGQHELEVVDHQVLDDVERARAGRPRRAPSGRRGPRRASGRRSARAARGRRGRSARRRRPWATGRRGARTIALSRPWAGLDVRRQRRLDEDVEAAPRARRGPAAAAARRPPATIATCASPKRRLECLQPRDPERHGQLLGGLGSGS